MQHNEPQTSVVSIQNVSKSLKKVRILGIKQHAMWCKMTGFAKQSEQSEVGDKDTAEDSGDETECSSIDEPDAEQ